MSLTLYIKLRYDVYCVETIILCLSFFFLRRYIVNPDDNSLFHNDRQITVRKHAKSLRIQYFPFVNR